MNLTTRQQCGSFVAQVNNITGLASSLIKQHIRNKCSIIADMTESINNEYFQITQNWETWENKSKKLKILFSEPEDKYPEFEEEEEERWNKELL